MSNKPKPIVVVSGATGKAYQKFYFMRMHSSLSSVNQLN